MRLLCCEWLFKKNVHIGYVCKNYILAKKFYKDFVQIFPQQFIKTSNGSDLIIETIFGSTLTFFSAESGNSLRGMTFDYLILDEAAFYKFDLPDGSHLWNEILFPTVKVQGKKVIFVSTPFGKNNLFYEMYLRGLSDEYPAYASLKKTIYNDAFVTEEEIKNIKKSIPELAFKQEFLCEFLDSANTFFNGYEQCFDYQGVMNNTNKKWIGIDLSGNGNDETILTIMDDEMNVFQYKIAGTLDIKYNRIAKIVNDTNNLQAVYIEKNGIGAPMINEVLKLVKNKTLIHEWLTTNTSKEEIVSNLAVVIANKDIHFNKDDNELFSQLGGFIVKFSKTNKLLFEGNNMHDDRVMSLAIALKCKQDFKYNSNNIIFI